MSEHLTDLQCAMYADGALAGEERQAVEQQLADCQNCAARVAAFKAEGALIRESLSIDEAIDIPEMPSFKAPISLKNFALANIMTGLVVWLGQFLWKTIFGELVINAIDQLSAIYIPDTYEILTSSVLYLTEEGITMIDTYLGYIAIALIAAVVGWFALKFRANRSFSLATGLIAALFLTVPTVEALEIRQDDNIVTIEANESIEDTVLMAGNILRIDGDVDGDVFAAGNTITVRGKVTGNLFTTANTIHIENDVGGTVAAAASSVVLKDMSVGGDLWSASARTTADEGVKIAGNVTVTGQYAGIYGEVARDFYGFAETIELSGRVERNLEAFARNLNLLPESYVGGNVRFRNHEENSLTQADTATIVGEIEYLDMPEEWHYKSPYQTGEFYMWLAVITASAFLLGLALFWLFPGVRDLTIAGGIDGVKTAGLGLVSFIVLPVACILLVVTVVGIPFALVGVFALLFLWMLSKIVIADQIGQMIFGAMDQEESGTLSFFVGLMVFVIAVSIPAIGGVISFVLTILGAGLLVQLMFEWFEDREAADLD